MNLQENIERIKKMMGLRESSIDKLLQDTADGTLDDLYSLTDDMGLGEMDELDEINSVDEIKVINFINNEVPVVSVDLYVNSDRRNYDNIITHLEIELSKYIPNTQVIVNNIIDTRY